MEDAKKSAIIEAVHQIKAKGGTAVKIELEANFNRSYESGVCPHCDEGQTPCLTCDDGTLECSNCEGIGQIDEVDCIDCDGTGSVSCTSDCDGGMVTCNECDGNYENERDWSSERECLGYIMDRIGIYDYDYQDNDDHEGIESKSPASWLKYIQFYNDGSVDSEVTATVLLDDDNNIFKLVDLIEAFKSLGDEIGGEFNVSGAGMHMAILFSKYARYPATSRLPEVQLTNYRRSMKQMLPALYFLAANGETTRPVNDYRQPFVSIGVRDRVSPYADAERKYSAIHYFGNAIEFRVFDTCYDKPETVLDNVVVMANSLKFLTDKYRAPKIESTIRRYRFGHDRGRELSRLYTEVSHLDLLTYGLQQLKPSYYTINELKKQRNFKINKRTLQLAEKKHIQEAETAYAEYAERCDLALIYQEAQAVADRLQMLVKHSPDKVKGKTNAELKAMVEADVKSDVEYHKRNRREKNSYVQDRVNEIKSAMQGQSTVIFG